MDEMRTQKERLLNFLQYLKIGQNKFEKSTGMATGLVSQWKNGYIPPKAMQKIFATYPELNETWLLTGVGEMLNTNAGGTDAIRFSIGASNETDKLRRENETLKENLAALRELVETQKMTIQALSDQVKMLKGGSVPQSAIVAS